MEHQPEHQPEQTDRNQFLARYFADKFEKSPVAEPYSSLTANWAVTPYLDPDGDKMITLVRTAENGDIDSYCINLDDPEDLDAHISVDGQLTKRDGQKQIKSQVRLSSLVPGILIPSYDKQTYLDEFIDNLRLFEEIDSIFK